MALCLVVKGLYTRVVCVSACTQDDNTRRIIDRTKHDVRVRFATFKTFRHFHFVVFSKTVYLPTYMFGTLALMIDHS